MPERSVKYQGKFTSRRFCLCLGICPLLSRNHKMPDLAFWERFLFASQILLIFGKFQTSLDLPSFIRKIHLVDFAHARQCSNKFGIVLAYSQNSTPVFNCSGCKIQQPAGMCSNNDTKKEGVNDCCYFLQPGSAKGPRQRIKQCPRPYF